MSLTSKQTGALEIFFSYAHEDRALLNAITKQLSPLKRQNLIKDWSDCNVSAGSPWKSIVEQYINTADIILFLVSPDFIASEYCYSVEMRQAMDRHERGEARVIPIILRPVDWLGLPFGTLKSLPEGGKAVTLWQTKDSALFDIANGIRKVVEELATKLRGNPPSPPTNEHILPSVWNIPYRRNPFFTGREAILTPLREAFLVERTTTGSILALSGLGGIGKTQIAVEYAYRYQSDYQAVLWIKADSRTDLISDMILLADILQLPERREPDQALVVGAVKRWLQRQKRWLLIFDNIEELDAVNDFIPQAYTGHILMTTRSQATGPVAHSIPIEKMDKEEGALLLLRRAKILSENAPLNEATGKEVMNAKEISQAIDGLPLALDQAGAYIEEIQKNLLDYLNLYRKRRTVLLKRRGRFVMDHPQSVLTTLSLSIEKVEQANPAALELLRLCSFLHPDAIPEELFIVGSPDLGPILQSITADSIELDNALEELLKFSLIRRNSDTRTLSLHRLVQVVVRDALSESNQRQWAERAVRIVNRVFPDVKFETWTLCQRYLPHAQVCIDLNKQWGIELRESVRLFYQVGEYLRERSLYAEAEPLLTQALEISQRVLGPEDRDTAQSLNNLAHLYRARGRLSLVKPLYERALAIREQVLGPEHPDTAQSLNNLAFLYRTFGELEKAESLYERALVIRERVLEPEHPETTNTLNNLARLYHVQGKYKEAEPLYQRALAIRESVLGVEHPDTAQSLGNMGDLYRIQGQYTQAEELLMRALAIRERALGTEHLDVAIVLNNIATLYGVQGKYKNAESLYQRILAIREKKLGLTHPDIAQILCNLGELYYEQEQYSQAEPFYQRALAIREQTLGLQHPDTAQNVAYLAKLHQQKHNYAEAKTLYQRALLILEKALGAEHPDVVRVQGNYTALLHDINRDGEARSM